jgi:hypothetical protein
MLRCELSSEAVGDDLAAEGAPGSVRQNCFAALGTGYAAVGQGERDASRSQAVFVPKEPPAANVIADLQSVGARRGADDHDAEEEEEYVHR